MKRKFTGLIITVSILASIVPQISGLSESEAAEPAQMEYLDRGTVAVKSGRGVYLSWRLLGTESYDTSFDIYRDNTYVTTVTDSTNYTDTTPERHILLSHPVRMCHRVKLLRCGKTNT